MLRNISDPTFVKCLCLSLCAGPMKKKASRSGVAASPMAVARSVGQYKDRTRDVRQNRPTCPAPRVRHAARREGGIPFDTNAATNNYP